MDHSTTTHPEAFTSKHKKNVLSDVLAKEALALLSANIRWDQASHSLTVLFMKLSSDRLPRRACEDGSDRGARMGMLLGSLYAGMAFSNSPCAAVHALAYPIGLAMKQMEAIGR